MFLRRNIFADNCASSSPQKDLASLYACNFTKILVLSFGIFVSDVKVELFQAFLAHFIQP